MGLEPNRFLRFSDTRLGAFTALLRVPVAGYRAETQGPDWGTQSPLPWLVERPPIPGKPYARRYSPFDRRHRGVLSDFMALRTADQARRFANRFGLLDQSPRLPVEAEGDAPLAAESLQLWRRHVRTVLTLFTLWESAEQQDREGLSEVVVWEVDPLGVSIYPGVALRRRVKGEREPAPLLGIDEGPAALLVPPMRFTELSHRDALLTPRGRRRWQTGDVVGPAKLYVCETLNKAVRGRVHPKLMPFADGQRSGPPLCFQADSLLSSLYQLLQLGVEGYDVPELVDLRPCPRRGCKNWFKAEGNRRVCADALCQKWLRTQRNLRYNLTKRGSPQG